MIEIDVEFVPGWCPRCSLFANIHFIHNRCRSCIVELAEGKPNLHGEGPVLETEDIVVENET